MRPIPETSGTHDWPRKVANTIKDIINAVRKLQEPDLLKLKPQARPADPTEGMMYFDGTDKVLRYFNGTTWTDL